MCLPLTSITQTPLALRRMLVLNKSARCARRDKHTPCIKNKPPKRQNRSRAERAVRAKPLANRARFSRTSAMRFFVLFFIGGFFLFLYQVAKSAFCLFGVGIAARVYLNMRFPIQISTQHLFF